MKKRLLILLVCCICAMSMSARKSQVSNKQSSTQQSLSIQDLRDSIPLVGLTHLWQFTSDGIVTLAGKKDISYEKIDKKGIQQVDTLYDGRIACRPKYSLALPWTVNTLPKTITLVAYLYSKKDASKNPTRVLCNGRIFSLGTYRHPWIDGPQHPDSYTGGLIEFDDGDFEIKVELDSTNNLYTVKQSPMPKQLLTDSASFVYFYMPIAISYDDFKHDEKDSKIADYNFALTIGGKQIRTHRRFFFDETKDVYDDDKGRLRLSIPSGYRITYLAAYERMLSDKEMASIMHEDAIDIFNPEDDPTSHNMNHVYYALGILAFMILVYGIHRLTRLSPISSPTEGDHEKAKRELDEAEAQFMIDGVRYYPSGDRMDKIANHLKSARKAGVSANLVDRYNHIVKIYNHCNGFVYRGSLTITLSLAMLVALLYDTSQFEHIAYTLKSNAFLDYYLIAAAMLLTGFTNRYKAINGEELDENNLNTSLIPDKKSFFMQIVWAASLIIFIPVAAGFGFAWLFFALVSILTYSWIIVYTPTGSVIASGMSWGCIPALILMVVAGPWILYWGQSIVIWGFVWLPPILCFIINCIERNDFDKILDKYNNEQERIKQEENAKILAAKKDTRIWLIDGYNFITVCHLKPGTRVEIYNSEGIILDWRVATGSEVKFENLHTGQEYIIKVGENTTVKRLI